MNINVSGVTMTSLYIVGLVIGSGFGFVAGILFLVVVYLIRKTFKNQEKQIDITDSASNSTFSQTDEQASSSAFTA